MTCPLDGEAYSGAASGAISSTLSGGDPGQGALYGAASAAAFYTAVSIGQATYEYYASKDVLGTSQVTMDHSGNVTPDNSGYVRFVSRLDTRIAPAPGNPGSAAQGIPNVLNNNLRTLGTFLLDARVDAAFAELSARVQYGQSATGSIFFNKGEFYVRGSALGRVSILREPGGPGRVIHRPITGTKSR